MRSRRHVTSDVASIVEENWIHQWTDFAQLLCGLIFNRAVTNQFQNKLPKFNPGSYPYFQPLEHVASEDDEFRVIAEFVEVVGGLR